MLLEKAEMDEYCNVPTRAIMGSKKRAEDKLLSQNVDWMRSESSLMDITEDKKMNLNAYCNFTCADESDICQNDRPC